MAFPDWLKYPNGQSQLLDWKTLSVSSEQLRQLAADPEQALHEMSQS